MSIHSLPYKPTDRELLEARIMDALEGRLDQQQIAELRNLLNAYPDLFEQWTMLHESGSELLEIPKEAFDAPALDLHKSASIHKILEKELFWEQLSSEMKRMTWRVVVPAATIAASLLLYFSSITNTSINSTSNEEMLNGSDLIQNFTAESQEYAALEQWVALEQILETPATEKDNE